MSDSIIFSNSDYLAQTTHSMQLARIPEFLIFHGSLCLVMGETWQATGQEVSDKVLFFHLQGWLLWQHPPLSGSTLMTGIFGSRVEVPEGHKATYLFQGHAFHITTWMAAICSQLGLITKGIKSFFSLLLWVLSLFFSKYQP